ncbi:phosphatase PAP2 family protein [Microbacterium sp.]|uniref:phosphatase PAP2 family protein n=1 Tax=Microbacterium sp. TaxID=51671 RepID=UPI003A8C6F91
MRRPPTDDVISVRLRFVVIGTVLVASAVLLGILIGFEGAPPGIDLWADARVDALGPVLRGLSLGMDIVGAGWFAVLIVPVGTAAVLLALRRPWAAVLFLVGLGTSALAVQVLKSAFDRARPEGMLVLSDAGSYPSGHVANAATVAVLAVIIFPRAWVAVAGTGWVMLMGLSRMNLHAHWFSDTVGGALVGVGVALMVAAAFAPPLMRERPARLPPRLPELS